MIEPYSGASHLEVIYNLRDITRAYAFNFYGFWGPVLIFLVLIILILTIITFSVGFVPKMIDLNNLSKTFEEYNKRR